MPGPSVTNQDHHILKDVTVMQLASTSDANVAGSAVDFVGIIETVEIELKREFTEVTGSHDDGKSSRAVRWDNGSVRMAGFSTGTGSKFSAIFASASHATFQFTESAGGDSYALLCRNETLTKSLGKDANRDTLNLTQEGVPYYAAAGGTLAAIPLTV